VIRGLANSPSGDFGTWADSISLLGAAAVLGLRIDSVAVRWPEVTDLAAILELRAPSPEWTTIGPLQFQLWLGLREMARMRSDSVSVSSEYGDAVLALWRGVHDDEEIRYPFLYHRQAKAQMLTWLEACCADGWRLIKHGD